MTQLPLGPDFGDADYILSSGTEIGPDFARRVGDWAVKDDGPELDWALDNIHLLESKEYIPILRHIIEQAVSSRAVFGAARRLASHDDLGNLPILLLALDRLWDTHEPVHRILARLLGLISVHKVEAWSYLLAQLDNPREPRQVNAAILVEALAGEADDWLLVDILSSQRSGRVRAWMVDHLADHIRKPGVRAAILAAFHDQDEHVRSAAILVLLRSEWDEAERQDLLRTALNDVSPHVQRTAQIFINERKQQMGH
jgi:hypothetical protein